MPPIEADTLAASSATTCRACAMRSWAAPPTSPRSRGVSTAEARLLTGVVDLERRAAYHARAVQLAMPMAREVYGRDCEQIEVAG